MAVLVASDETQTTDGTLPEELTQAGSGFLFGLMFGIVHRKRNFVHANRQCYSNLNFAE